MSEPAASHGHPSPYEQAKALASLGLTALEIKRKLMERGLDAESAGVLARTVGTQESELDIAAMAQEPLDPGGRGIPTDAVIGAIICLVGVVITVVTHAAAMERGGTYVIAYGAIIGGAIRVITGLSGRR
ncbi:MAG TPA: hypothetical protein VK447_11625 [Myxococcaceae bacterium]|nr:hypothetical protein [Myxococcaceae bacterium]